MELLNKIQKELKAPKGQLNSFGNYKYRSCEDILEAVKPLLGKGNLLITDEVVNIGDRYYVKATAVLSEGENARQVSAYAREPLEKKGMDSAQITGATSSYARKYALNGLFCIDDTKDADTMDNNKVETKTNQPAKQILFAKLKKDGITGTEDWEVIKNKIEVHTGILVKSKEEMTEEKYRALVDNWNF